MVKGKATLSVPLRLTRPVGETARFDGGGDWSDQFAVINPARMRGQVLETSTLRQIALDRGPPMRSL